jgi:hypothetical protein
MQKYCDYSLRAACTAQHNSSRLVSINYTLEDYLPEGAESTVAMKVMKDEFGASYPNARVMISDIYCQ